MDDLVKLLTGNAITINRIASLLEENDIPSMIRDNAESARVAGFGVPQNSAELFVNPSDQERARQIIEDLDVNVEND